LALRTKSTQNILLDQADVQMIADMNMAGQ